MDVSEDFLGLEIYKITCILSATAFHPHQSCSFILLIFYLISSYIVLLDHLISSVFQISSSSLLLLILLMLSLLFITIIYCYCYYYYLHL